MKIIFGDGKLRFALICVLALAISSTHTPYTNAKLPTNSEIGSAQSQDAVIKQEILSALEQLKAQAEQEVYVSWGKQSAGPRIVAGQLSLARAQQPDLAARDFLSAHRSLFQIDNPYKLALVDSRDSLQGHHIRFEQTYGGLPVFGGQIAVHLDRDNRIVQVNNSYLPVKSRPDMAMRLEPELSASSAFESVKQRLQISDVEIIDNPRLVVYLQDGAPQLAWQIAFGSDAPVRHWLAIVDAQSGQLLELRDALQSFQAKAEGRGQVFITNAITATRNNNLRDPRVATGNTCIDISDSPDAVPDSAYTTVRLTNLDGSGYLRGLYVDTGLTPWRAYEADLNFIYRRDDRRFEEVESYWAINAAQEYIQSLGLNVNQRTVMVNAHACIPGSNQDNSYYSFASKSIYLGNGGVNDGEDAEVIWHEYGHAIQDNQCPWFGIGAESAALAEGFADYFAATMSQQFTAFQSEYVAEWDATSRTSITPPHLRRVDGVNRYPIEFALQKNAHKNGEIWSGVLWQINQRLGRDTANKIILEHTFYLSSDATFYEAALALLRVDDRLYGGANKQALLSIFRERIIGFTESAIRAGAPRVTLTAPVSEQVVAGSVRIVAEISDKFLVDTVSFQLDGRLIGNPITLPPYEMNFDTRSLANGRYTVRAIVRDLMGNESVSPQAAITVRNPLRGDLNLDGKVSVNDLTRLIQHITGESLLTGESFQAADLDRDEAITIRDMIMLIQMLMNGS